ncbi:ATP-binding protein [Phormidium sp. CCY1219]|uniref:ATP-binding protein n=1 Tax=Phormidium sp. CCY1219 TaxID=2886104 RepID=UPI002D1F210B|nr:ATP-binding protein [Phormidium sp. CCY1219]MEB3827271.1 ATP-binding protein [Phormidium sp. CCY1219]
MANSDSPLEQINAAIQRHNPFTKAGIVQEQNIWGKGFPDVPTLNKEASDAVLQAIERVSTSQSSADKVATLVVTAEAGVGKTHLISRIRHQLPPEKRVSFVYANGNNYTDLNLIKYQFQQTLVESLSRTGREGVMQWQEIATSMANQGLQAINPNAASLSSQELVKRFDRVYQSFLANNKDLMNILSKKVAATKPETDPYILRGLLWTLSERYGSYAVEWLAGNEIDPSTAETMGLPSNGNKTNEDREAEALSTIQKILKLVNGYTPILICFDEIDVLNQCNDDGYTTPMLIADFIKRLYDTIIDSNVSQGVVILTLMFPDTWSNSVKQMGTGVPARISTFTQSKPLGLKYVNSDVMVDVVATWMQEFYQARQLTPPHPLYPFEETQLRQYGKNKPTVREALRWCAENFKVDEEPLPEDPRERFELALTNAEELEPKDYTENNELIAAGLRFGFETLIGETLAGETSTGETLNNAIVQQVVDVEPKSKNQGWINFKIVVEENNQPIQIGVAVLQHDTGRAVGAGMKRLIDYDAFGLTRSCLVRSKDKPIKKNWASSGYLEELIYKLRGEWVYLEEEHIKLLIDLYLVYEQCDRYQLSDEQFKQFCKAQTQTNPLLLEILSDPSGKIDEETLEEEELLNAFLQPTDIEATPNEDEDLRDLFG